MHSNQKSSAYTASGTRRVRQNSASRTARRVQPAEAYAGASAQGARVRQSSQTSSRRVRQTSQGTSRRVQPAQARTVGDPNQGRRIQRAHPNERRVSQNEGTASRRIQPANEPQNERKIRKNRPSRMPRSPQQPKKPRKWPKRLAIVLLVIVAVGAGGLAYFRFAPLNLALSGNYSKYNISKNAAAMGKSERIVNVAIFGVDGRDDVEGDRSDSIMIASADFEHSKLKVTSLMRDTYTYNEQTDTFDKLNAAYSEGGADLALKVINENFDTPITDYVTIDFTALVEVVNAVGGVDINVTDDEELYWINQYLADVNDKVGTSDPELTSTGTQTLTGSQALAYSRIRYTGNGDYDRTQRQRNVLEQIVAKASSLSPIKLISLVQTVLPYIQTSLSTSEIAQYLVNVMLMSDKTIEQFRLPADGMVTDGYLDGVSYVFPDTLVDNIETWYQFVYEKDYTPSTRAQEISNEILDAIGYY